MVADGSSNEDRRWETDTAESAVTDLEQERVYVSLYHAHVPKLVEEGVIAFDEDSEMITAAENAKQVLAALHGMGATLDLEQETHARGDMNDEGECHTAHHKVLISDPGG